MVWPKCWDDLGEMMYFHQKEKQWLSGLHRLNVLKKQVVFFNLDHSLLL